jgi:hypothetical protein
LAKTNEIACAYTKARRMISAIATAAVLADPPQKLAKCDRPATFMVRSADGIRFLIAVNLAQPRLTRLLVLC